MSTALHYLCLLPAMLIALTFHEFCHGLMAKWLGDPTAQRAGRLTMNPLKHLNVPGAICMILFHFGWATPVPVNPGNFKNPKKGMALTALAGPLGNLLLAFIGTCLFTLFEPILQVQEIGGALYYYETWQLAVYLVLWAFYTLNLTLAIFNFIPIPPLDGSRILLFFLPERIYFAIMKYENKILLGVFAYFLICRAADSFFNVDINFISMGISRVVSFAESGMLAFWGLFV